MTDQHAEEEIISTEKRGTLTEPHYMFCGMPVEEHCSRVNNKLFTEQYKN